MYNKHVLTILSHTQINYDPILLPPNIKRSRSLKGDNRKVVNKLRSTNPAAYYGYIGNNMDPTNLFELSSISPTIRPSGRMNQAAVAERAAAAAANHHSRQTHRSPRAAAAAANHQSRQTRQSSRLAAAAAAAAVNNSSGSAVV